MPAPSAPASAPSIGLSWMGSRGIPDPHRSVQRTTGQAMAVGAKAHARNTVRVSLEGKQLLAALGFPNPHRVVVGTGGQALAVGTESHARHRVGMPPQGEQFLAPL